MKPTASPASALAALLLTLAGCASTPPPPDWQLSARAALDQSVAAYLGGNPRAETQAFERARRELAATGRFDLVARAELTRCAARVASLVLDPCTGFDALRADAPPAEQAYADYLAGLPHDAALLPAAQRGAGPDTLGAIGDPLARLVAAGVLLRTGRASPTVIAAAVDTASAQGWRRPLLAWLQLQLQRAEQAGAEADAQRLRRRIALIAGPPPAR